MGTSDLLVSTKDQFEAWFYTLWKSQTVFTFSVHVLRFHFSQLPQTQGPHLPWINLVAIMLLSHRWCLFCSVSPDVKFSLSLLWKFLTCEELWDIVNLTLFKILMGEEFTFQQHNLFQAGHWKFLLIHSFIQQTFVKCFHCAKHSSRCWGWRMGVISE